jgi:hypothetical protein
MSREQTGRSAHNELWSQKPLETIDGLQHSGSVE